MSPAAGPALPSDRTPSLIPTAAMVPTPTPQPVGVISPASEMVAKDAIMAWYRGEFAAANAIIDVLCNHLMLVSGGGAEYEAAFNAIHRRRMNWIPVIQMQKYYPIIEITHELRNLTGVKKPATVSEEDHRHHHHLPAAVVKEEKIEVVSENRETCCKKEEEVVEKKSDDCTKKVDDDPSNEECNNNNKCNGDGGFGESVDEDSPDSEITDTGSHEGHPNTDHIEICENHELECGSRREQIKMTKGFVAKEPVKGHMVNVVKGLKMYENIFKSDELTRMNDFVYKLRTAGQNGELSGETYVLFNKQIKGNKREQIHLGYPIFGTPKDDAGNEQQKTNIEPIPVLLHSVVDHLVQWQIIPESRKPNGCIINYFDEGESSQPYLKPPHVDQPICILMLSETTLAFGRTLVNNGEGNIKGHLMLPVTEGSVLVMRNNSADMARHIMCPSETKRVSITFFRIRPDADRNSHYIRGHNNYNNYNHNRNNNSQPTMLAPLATQAMTVWQQPGMPLSPCSNNMIANGFGPMNLMVPKYGMVGGPMLMLAAPMNMARPAGSMNNKRMLPHGGTGVFLPWAKGGSRKPTKHLPPRAQRSRLLALPPPSTITTTTVEEPQHQMIETMSDPGSEMKEM